MISKHIEVANIVLLSLSFVLAIFLPFDTFLFSYAVLGPLHYLTELHWLKQRSFFIDKNKMYKIFFISCVTIIPVVLLGLSFYFFGVKINAFYSLILIIFFLISACLAVYFSNEKFFILLSICLLLIGFIYYFKIGFLVALGVFIPTLVHVYLFTALFMLMGYFKNPNKLSLLNILLLFIVPIFIYFLPVEDLRWIYSYKSEQVYKSTNFKYINDWIILIFNGSSLKSDVIFIKMQIFIAFAYTYHYLNWFSKTSVIGWSKTLGLKKGIFVLAIWILSIALYWKNYQLGLTVLFVLSMMHVLAEFPLNVLSIKTVGQKIFRK